MNTLIGKLMETAVCDPWQVETWAEQNTMAAHEYVRAHYGRYPFGELETLIAEQAMDEGRVKIKQSPVSTIDSFVLDSRGIADINRLFGFISLKERNVEEESIESKDALILRTAQSGKTVLYRQQKFNASWIEHMIAIERQAA